MLNTHVITVDYRGFGDSQGWPTEQGERMEEEVGVGVEGMKRCFVRC